jgi:selenophosphate synthetase-related protein
MSIDFPDDAPRSEEMFEQALRNLIHGARKQGVNVLGGWECRTDGDGDYEAVIVELSESLEK